MSIPKIIKQAIIESPRKAGLLFIPYVGEILVGFAFGFIERIVNIPLRLQWSIQAVISLAIALCLMYLAAKTLGYQTRGYVFSIAVVSDIIGAFIFFIFIFIFNWPTSSVMLITKLIAGINDYSLFEDLYVPKSLILSLNAAAMLLYTIMFVFAEWRGHKRREEADID